MKRIFQTILLAVIVLASASSCRKTIKSPDGRVEVVINSKELCYDLKWDGKTILENSVAQLVLGESTLAWNKEIKPRFSKTTCNKEVFDAPLYRQDTVVYQYNEMTMDFGNKFSMEWRVSNDGVAYRFTSSREEETVILSEQSVLKFKEDHPFTYGKSNNSSNPYNTSFESYYYTTNISEGSDFPVFLPASADLGQGKRLTIAESDVKTYPGSFLRPSSSKAGDCAAEIAFEFAPYPGQNYIAMNNGATSYPWRILKLTEKDSQIAEDDLVYALSEPYDPGMDWSWVKPGYSAWEWWNDFGLENVTFKPGINNETYRAYIDFAAANGLEYVTVDEGWGKRGPGQNLLIPIPSLDLQGLAEYAASKGIRLILWSVFNRLASDTENVCEMYEKMGIAGFKTDFYGRNDQEAVEKICRTAGILARHHMILDLHGSYPQMGLNRTYPNIVNAEGVTGLENCKWNSPDDDFMAHDATLAFLRQMAGPCDYTPGAMVNYTRDSYHADYSHPGSQGTRAHQVALYGVLDSPLAMLCDSPTNYSKEQETTSWISSLPRSFTSKKVLDGQIGEFIVVARETSDGRWCISGITNWEERKISIPTDFLNGGKWHCNAFTDCTESYVNPQTYLIESYSLESGNSLEVSMAPGGGFYIILKKE